MTDSLTRLQEIARTDDPAAKAALIAELVLDDLPAETAQVARQCAVLHWFDEQIVAALLPADSPVTAAAAYQQLASLPFVEPVPSGLAYNGLTRQGLLDRYARDDPSTLVGTAALVAPVYGQDGRQSSLAEAFYCYAIAGDADKAGELLDRALGASSVEADYEPVARLTRMREEAEALPFVRPLPSRLRQRIVQRAQASTSAQRERNRDAMIASVRSTWIEGVLERSLYHVARIELGLETRPDAVHRPWDVVLERPQEAPRTLPSGRRISAFYDDLGGALLILGVPGVGKTTMLLELARDLLDRAERDEMQLMPVVLNLSTWAARRRPLEEWLVTELETRYSVPRRIAQQWIDEEQVLPLLDGLDEVAPTHREACVEAINAFHDRHPLVSLVVCSRVADYEALSTQLRLQAALIIQPLDRAQVDAYLAEAGASLDSVRGALQADPALYDLLDTPLMLSVVAMAYRDTQNSSVQLGESLAERRRHLFQAYTKTMFARRGADGTYTFEQTECWLGWLASQMVAHHQTAFYLEAMQPDWLPTGRGRWLASWGAAIASWLNFGAYIGAPLGLVFGLALGWDMHLDPAFEMPFGLLVFYLVFAAGAGILFGGIAGLLASLISLVTGRTAQYAREIRPAETLRWSWAMLLGGWWRSLLIGLAVTLLVIIGFVIGGAVSIGACISPSLGLIAAMVSLLLSGLETGRMEIRTEPGEGIRRSARNAFVAGLGGGLAVDICIVMLVLLVAWLIEGRLSVPAGIPTVAALCGSVVGFVFGLIGGMASGGLAWIQHRTLRKHLQRRGLIPKRYVHFLDYAADRILLRKVGGGYIFVHRMLQEYFAELWERTYAITQSASQ